MSGNQRAKSATLTLPWARYTFFIEASAQIGIEKPASHFVYRLT
jgi:hypothetical protein